MSPTPVEIIKLTDVLLRSLGTRVLAAMALAMTCALFAWAMFISSWQALSISGAFALCVLWPVLAVGWFARRDADG